MTQAKYKSFNGHKNYNHWNVSLWLNNDEGLYEHMKQCLSFARRRGLRKDAAAQLMLDQLKAEGMDKTPDGAPYSVSSILAAMRDL